MASIKKVLDTNGDLVFPLTHTNAVVDNNGNSVESRLGQFQDEINAAQLETGAVPSDLTPVKSSTNYVTSGGLFSSLVVEGTNIFDIESETLSLSASTDSYMSITQVTGGFEIECLQAGGGKYAFCTIKNAEAGKTYAISFDYEITNESSADYAYMITVRSDTTTSSTALKAFRLQEIGMSGSVTGVFTAATSTTVLRVANNDIAVVGGKVKITNISVVENAYLKNISIENKEDIKTIGENQVLSTINSLTIDDCVIGTTNSTCITIEKSNGKLLIRCLRNTNGTYAYIKLPKWLKSGKQYILSAIASSDYTANSPLPLSRMSNLSSSHGGLTILKNSTSAIVTTTFTYNGTDDCLRMNASSLASGKVVEIEYLQLQAVDSDFRRVQILEDEGDFSEATTVGTYVGSKIPSIRTHKFGWTKIMDSQTTGSIQGGAAYNGYLFEFVDSNAYVYVYNLATKTYHSKVYPTNITTGHCNTACFSNIFFDASDDFPLLYVSGGSTAEASRHCQVYRITLSEDTFTITQVQDLILPEATDENDLYGANVFLDNQQGYEQHPQSGTPTIVNGYLWISGNRGINGTYWAKFRIPDVTDSEGNAIAEAELTDSDMIEKFYTDSVGHRQSGIVVNGICYMMAGVPAWGDKVYFYAVDLWGKHLINNRVNLTSMRWTIEPEGLSLYNGELYCNTQKQGIYKFYF